MNNPQHDGLQELMLQAERLRKDSTPAYEYQLIQTEKLIDAWHTTSLPAKPLLIQSEAQKIIAHKLTNTPASLDLLESIITLQSMSEYKRGVSTQVIFDQNNKSIFYSRASISSHLNSLRRVPGNPDALIIKTPTGWLVSKLGLEAFKAECLRRGITD